MNVRNGLYGICNLQFIICVLNEWTDGFKGKFKKLKWKWNRYI